MCKSSPACISSAWMEGLQADHQQRFLAAWRPGSFKDCTTDFSRSKDYVEHHPDTTATAQVWNTFLHLRWRHTCKYLTWKEMLLAILWADSGQRTEEQTVPITGRNNSSPSGILSLTLPVFSQKAIIIFLHLCCVLRVVVDTWLVTTAWKFKSHTKKYNSDSSAVIPTLQNSREHKDRLNGCCVPLLEVERFSSLYQDV